MLENGNENKIYCNIRDFFLLLLNFFLHHRYCTSCSNLNTDTSQKTKLITLVKYIIQTPYYNPFIKFMVDVLLITLKSQNRKYGCFKAKLKLINLW